MRIPWGDAALAAGLAVLGVLGALTGDEYAGGTPRLTVAMLLQTLPLAWRRVAPLPAVLVSAFGVAVEVAGVAAYGDPAGFVGFLLLVYSSARWAAEPARRTAAAVLGAGFAVHLVAQPHEGPLGLLGPVVVTGAITTAAWSAGTGLRSRAARVAELEEETARAAQREARLVEEERRRIARELHDIVGHALSAISLTSGAAERRAEADVAVALRLIRRTSSDAAADVRRLVGLLRTDADLAGTDPQPTLGGVSTLVERCAAAGLHVQLRVQGDPSRPSLGVQLAAFRVVQEGLTNVLKHAPEARVDVFIRIDADRVEVVVEDHGPAARSSPVPHQRGHGLIGLQERVALYDGVLEAGPCDGGGFRLAAVLPAP